MDPQSKKRDMPTTDLGTSLGQSQLRQRLEKRLQVLDQNGDGMIAKESLMQVLKKILTDFSDQDLVTLVDGGGNTGQISLKYADWLDWIFAALERNEEGHLLSNAALPNLSATSLARQLGSIAQRDMSCASSSHAGDGHREPLLSELDWSVHVDIPQKFCQPPVRVSQTHWRAISLLQLGDIGDLVQRVLAALEINDPRSRERLVWASVNLYHINELFVLPLTRNDRCSFVELVAQGPQTPQWFVSHWWGTCFRDTLDMLNFHATERNLQKTDPYWICTFANNQHDLAELTVNLMQTPFVKAILDDACQGTLMLMNHTAEPFKRTWCTLENFISTTHARQKKKISCHLLDIAAVILEGEQKTNLRMIPRSPALLMDDGCGNFLDRAESVAGQFPKEVSLRGIHVDIATAQASNPNDKKNILRFISGEVDPTMVPPAAHPRYEEVNRAIHRIFAPRAMYFAAQNNEVQGIQRLIDGGLANPNWQNPRGMTSLYVAASSNSCAAIRVLLDALADVDLQSDQGITPVCIAAQLEHFDAVHLLISARADLNLSDSKRSTPLSVATLKNHVNMARVLIEATCAIDQPSKNGTYPVLTASMKNHIEVLEVLLNARANPDPAEETSGYHSPLQAAAEKNNMGALKLLLSARADADRPTWDGATPIFLAAAEGHTAVVDALITFYADVHLPVHVGCTPMMVAAYYGWTEVASRLLSAGARTTDATSVERFKNETNIEPFAALTSLRPTTLSIRLSRWITVGAPSLVQASGKHYYELLLGTRSARETQVGWLSSGFEEREVADGKGVGDDEHGWAADGARMKRWHKGAAGVVHWPEPWSVKGVIGCAIDIDAGIMQFSYNGEWCKDAEFEFSAEGRAFYPAASLPGEFSFLLTPAAFRFGPPDASYQPLLAAQEVGKHDRPRLCIDGSPLEIARRSGHSEICKLLEEHATRTS